MNSNVFHTNVVYPIQDFRKASQCPRIIDARTNLNSYGTIDVIDRRFSFSYTTIQWAPTSSEGGGMSLETSLKGKEHLQAKRY